MFPENPTLKHYQDLFDIEKSNYVLWYLNSMKISLITMVFAVIKCRIYWICFLTLSIYRKKKWTAYVFSPTNDSKLRCTDCNLCTCQRTGLIDTHLGLILIYVGGQIPMNTWLMKGYLDTIPKELDESARMDGAGHLRIFWQIIMPLSKPIIAVVALFSFIAPFGDFILARIMLRSEEKFTMGVGLYELVSKQFGNEFTTFAAGSVLIAIPITILFLSFQKYFISGLTAGGTKG